MLRIHRNFASCARCEGERERHRAQAEPPQTDGRLTFEFGVIQLVDYGVGFLGFSRRPGYDPSRRGQDERNGRPFQ